MDPRQIRLGTLIQQYVERALAGTWPSDNEPEVMDDPQAEQLIYRLQDAILALVLETCRQRALDKEMEGEVRRLIELRWTLVEEATTSLNVPLVLVIWVTLIFTSFGYNAPRNVLVMTTFILCAASIGGARFLVVQLDRPFGGSHQLRCREARLAACGLEMHPTKTNARFGLHS
jgi:hypothetical protein